MKQVVIENSLGGGNMTDYHISTFYSEEDGGTIADIPDLEACSAFGEPSEKPQEELGDRQESLARSGPQSWQTHPPTRYLPVI